MYLSLDWLKDFVELPRSLTPEELGLKLTMHTVEIDSVEKLSQKYDKVIVGKIEEVKKHPNADKLQLAIVDIGGDLPLKIVCGAFNIEAEQLVPVALPGATLPNGAEIKAVEVRGEKSEGMLCAEDELKLGQDHTGILILDKTAKVGQNFSEYLGVKDVVFEVDNKSITHRPDLWSHYGMAREIATFLETKLKDYEPKKKALKAEKNEALNVKVEDFDLCPRYMAVAMNGIKIEQSPKWLQERLIAVGMRPINNIVDITNYIMLELGQPLHAFDRKLVDRIIVRRAKEDEILETLDGEERKLSRDMLVIADSKQAIAIAGVMGGGNSEISEITTEIIIESANFNFISIRKTSSTLGLRSESSMRFEKALDPNLAGIALMRSIELIKKICPQARVISTVKDEKKFKLDTGPIELNLDWLNQRVGKKINKERVIKILEKLGFGIEDKDENLRVIAPTWRATRDISTKEDLLEEVVRIYGYDKLPITMPMVEMRAPQVNEEREFIRKVKTILTGTPSLTEVYNYSFVGEEQLTKLNIDYSNHIRLANPIASHQTMLRQGLAPNLIANVKTNQARYDWLGIFETGSIYLPAAGEISKDTSGKASLPYQEKRLGIMIAEDDWEAAFNYLKGIVSHLFNSLGLSVDYNQSETAPLWSDKEASTEIMVNDVIVGEINKLSSEAKKSLGIKITLYLAELSVVKVFNLYRVHRDLRYEEHEKYPPAIRDLAFVLNEKILYNVIRNEIFGFSEFIKSVELFDVYTDEKLGRGKKNMAFHIIYQADRTLTSDEVDKIQQSLIKHIEDKFDAKVRDF